MHLQVSVCQACSESCTQKGHEITTVDNVCKVIHLIASNTIVEKVKHMSISDPLHSDMNVIGIYECRLNLIEHALKQILKSFKIALKNRLDDNPNATVAVTLWQSLSVIQTVDSVRNKLTLSRLHILIN